jgi:hypothetical protein
MMTNNKQVKAYVPTDVALAFKSFCDRSGVSLSAELSRLMSGHIACVPAPASLPTNTRGDRRKAVKAIILALQMIYDKENDYLDNFPENLQSAPAYASSETSLDCLSTAIETLSDAF